MPSKKKPTSQEETLAQKLKIKVGKVKPLVLRPEILLCENIPGPMQGLAPRVIFGKKWWDKTRKEAYRSTLYHCAACGVYKGEAKFRPWLEGHELYHIDYRRGRMIYLETVPLCHCCHNYIHSGRLKILLTQGKISHKKYTEIIKHGDTILFSIGLRRPRPYSGPRPTHSKWRLVINDQEYPPISDRPSRRKFH